MGSITQVPLGASGLLVGHIGLGCMGMSAFYTSDVGVEERRAECLRTLQTALDHGITLFDTAEIYGPYTNEELLGSAVAGRRSQFVLATKFGISFSPEKGLVISGSPETIAASLEGSLRRLNVDCIDLYYQHRMDPSCPIETTVACLAEYVKQGKIRAIGLSECSADTLRRAHKVHPIAAVQVEYSLWTRDIERNGLLAVCRELNVAVVAYSPLGRGFFSGNIKKQDDLRADDWRQSNPRFQADALAQNLKALDIIQRIADTHSATPIQIALAWVLAQGTDVIPIPGTSRSAHLLEFLGALKIQLTREDFDLLNPLEGMVVGTRYDERGMKAVNI